MKVAIIFENQRFREGLERLITMYFTNITIESFVSAENIDHRSDIDAAIFDFTSDGTAEILQQTLGNISYICLVEESNTLNCLKSLANVKAKGILNTTSSSFRISECIESVCIKRKDYIDESLNNILLKET